MAPGTLKLFPLVLGPACGVAGWLLFRTGSGQPTQATFWFAVLVSLGVGTIFGFALTRRIRRSLLYGLVTSILAFVVWLTWLSQFITSVNT